MGDAGVVTGHAPAADPAIRDQATASWATRRYGPARTGAWCRETATPWITGRGHGGTADPPASPVTRWAEDQPAVSLWCQATAAGSVSEATWSIPTRSRAASSGASLHSGAKTGSSASGARTHSASTSSARISR